MRIYLKALLATAVIATLTASGLSQEVDDSVQENRCVDCHGNSDVWEGDTLHLLVTPADLANDIHWQKGIRCVDCHGGNPDTVNLREAHAEEDGFRSIETPADVPDFCGHCHSNAEYMKEFQPAARTDQVARFRESVHGRHLQEVDGPAAATCTSCHPKHEMRPVGDPASVVHSSQLVETCGNCHQDQRTALRKGVHHTAGDRNELDAGTPLDCSKCHGADVHGMVPVGDSNSPVFLDHQVQTCGGCHEKHLDTYNLSVHGQGLTQSGLLVTAVCADCHDAHDIYYAADKRSTLHTANVAATCGNCHQFIEERLEASVHGRGSGVGETVEKAAPGGTIERKPSCVDCHRGHDHAHPDSDGFRLLLPNRCGNCHAELSLGYSMSLHGELTQLGYEPAAKCSDCHGFHDILPADDPKSRLAPGNRTETCRQCHMNAVPNFAGFDPHANHKDERRYAGLHDIYAGTQTVVYLLFGVFALHAILWFGRSLIQTLRFGRHKRLATEQRAVVRVAPIHRVSYLLMLVAFVGLALTGLPLKFSHQAWAEHLARNLGGFESTSVFHHFFAAMLLVCCATHLVRGVKKIAGYGRRGAGWAATVFGPDSPVPNGRDAKDFLAMVRWFFGAGPKPRFERWTYWEKLDYWAIYLAVGVIGASGLLLWFPNFFCLILPGSALNLAKVMHSETALLIASLVFVVHFFNTHFRPEKFPLDLSVLTGMVSEEHLRDARPEYLDRLQREGKLEQLQIVVPSARRLWPAIYGGVALLALGLLLWIWIVLANLGK